MLFRCEPFVARVVHLFAQLVSTAFTCDPVSLSQFTENSVLPTATMPPALGSSRAKAKAREPRRSGSRNTTPSSGLSAGTVSSSSAAPSTNIYLDIDLSKLAAPPAGQYVDVLEKLNGSGQIPDSKSLESLVEIMNSMGELADSRGDACNAGMKEVSHKRKELEGEDAKRCPR